MAQDEFLRTRMGRWHLPLFINKWDFFSSKLGTYMLNFVRICSTSWERHDFHYRIQEESLISGSVMRMVQRSCWDTPRLATQGVLQGWGSEWRWVAGDMTQRLRMLAFFQRTGVWFPAYSSGGPQLLVIPAAGTFNTLFWVLPAPAHMHKHADTYK